MRPRSLVSRRRVLAMAAPIALAATCRLEAEAQSGDPEAFSVALDWYPNANHAGLFLARERGYYADEGLAPDFYTPSDPTTVLQTVGAGRDAFGISYQTDTLLARAAGIPVVSVLALVQVPLQGVMVLASSGIARPRDLVGKTVGYPGIPSQEAFLATMLADDGASMADVELINIEYDLVPALIAGRVDASLGAYWTHETILAERFLRATRRGYEAAIADPAAAIAALKAASPDLDEAVETKGIALLIPAWTAGDAPFGTQTAQRWHDYARWMVEHNLIPADLDVGAAWRGDLLTPAATPMA